jgi:subtilisin family serine protease
VPLSRLASAGSAALAFALAGCGSESPASPDLSPSLGVTRGGGEGQYILSAAGSGLPAALDRSVQQAGGRLVAVYPQVGLAIARSAGWDFAGKAERISGIHRAIPDQRFRWQAPTRVHRLAKRTPRVPVDGRAIEDGAFLYPRYQWAPRAIEAPAAWAAGQLGAGARVAVLDGGIWALHPDLALNLDVARAASFATDADGNPTDWFEDIGDFWHGTHVAGIVGASASFGSIGIAPRATIIPVKVLHDGSGDFGGLIQGILYAAAPVSQGGAGAHIINLSLGLEIEHRGSGIAQLASFLSRVTSFARQQGVLLIASTGNSAFDLDHTNNLISIPAQSVGVLAIAATGPVNVAGGGTNFDRPASYTNFGQSAVHFAAPGGDFTLFPVDAWFEDMVLSTNVGGWAFAAGTSMAAPAASGVAALIIGRYGPLAPSRIEALLRASADDLGKPGNDDFYGSGRLNARKAVQ